MELVLDKIEYFSRSSVGSVVKSKQSYQAFDIKILSNELVLHLGAYERIRGNKIFTITISV